MAMGVYFKPFGEVPIPVFASKISPRRRLSTPDQHTESDSGDMISTIKGILRRDTSAYSSVRLPKVMSASGFEGCVVPVTLIR